MTKIYKRSDRIKVKIDDVVVTLAPLGVHDKTEAQSLLAKGSLNNDLLTMQKGLIVLLKCAVKDISGLTNLDNSEYRLQFEGEKLTDECIDDLFNIELHKKLIMVCTSLVKGMSSDLTDHDGNKIEGVEIIKDEKVNTNPN